MTNFRKKILRNKKMIIYSVFFIVILVANVFMFFKNFSSSNFNNQQLIDLAARAESSLAKKQSAQVKAVLEHNLFNTLKKIGDWPVEPKQHIGKPDPFIPFFTSQ